MEYMHDRTPTMTEYITLRNTCFNRILLAIEHVSWQYSVKYKYWILSCYPFMTNSAKKSVRYILYKRKVMHVCFRLSQQIFCTVPKNWLLKELQERIICFFHVKSLGGSLVISKSTNYLHLQDPDKIIICKVPLLTLKKTSTVVSASSKLAT